MPHLETLLRRLRRAPEPIKRRLRPALVRAVACLRAMPGGRWLAHTARRLSPAAYAWLHRRYVYYADNAIGRPARLANSVAPDLGAEAQIVLGWLRRAGAGRVN